VLTPEAWIKLQDHGSDAAAPDLRAVRALEVRRCSGTLGCRSASWETPLAGTGSETVVRWDPAELRAHRAQREDLLVLDVRTADARQLHPYEIPGARWMPLADVVQHAGSLPRDAPIVAYCT